MKQRLESPQSQCAVFVPAVKPIFGAMVQPSSRKSAHQHKLEMQGSRDKEAANADELMKMKKDESLGQTFSLDELEGQMRCHTLLQRYLFTTFTIHDHK